jgi:hypothetical protein
MANKVSILQAVKEAKKADRKARLNRAKTKDSFHNFEARLGLGTDNLAAGGTYGFFPVTRNRILLEWIHRGSWLGGVAVDLKGDDMTRAGVEITASELDVDEIEEIHEAASYLNIWPAVNDCVRWSALYGGAIAVLLIEGQDMSTPLRVDTIKPNQFKGMITLDRWMVNPSLNDLVAVYGPDLGLPKFYTVTQNAPALRGEKIHHSRVLRMVGIDLPYNQRMAENLWGISVYERLYDRMLAFDSATTGAAQLVYKSYLRTYKIEDLRENIAAGGAQLEGTVQYVDFMSKYQSIEGITLMDAKDEFAEHGATAFAGIGEALSKFGEQIAGALQMPLVRLFGQSPAGFSSGDADIRAYYDSIKQQQEKHLRIPLTTIYRCIAKSLGMEVGDGFKIEFRSLWQLSDGEKATIAGGVTTMIVNAKEAGLITLKTAMEELRRSGNTTGYYSSTISDEDIEQADDGEPPMPAAVEQAAMTQGDPTKTDEKELSAKPTPKEKGKDSAATFDSAEFKEEEHPRREDGKFGPKGTPGSSGSGKADLGKWAAVFASPNRGNLNFSEALTAMRSPQQKAFEHHVTLLLKTSLHAKSATAKSCLGVWHDGAENSAHFTFEIHSKTAAEDLKYAAAVIGLDADQKAVLTWLPSGDGPHKLYSMKATGSIEEITQKLEDSGIQNSTVEEEEDGSLTVYMLDQEGTLEDKVNRVALENKFDLQSFTGSGDFIPEGWIDDREECHVAQRKIIEEYKNRRQITGDAAPDDETVECQIFIGGLRRPTKTSDAAPFKESEHPRNHGQFAEKAGGSSIKLKLVKKRAWNGEQVELKNKISKLQTGSIGESVIIEYLRMQGIKDARSMNMKGNNFPIDLIGDHRLVEVKSGLASNGPSAQQWRATQGEPPEKTKKWLLTASAEDKKEFNQKMAAAIIKRKEDVLRKYQKKIGKKIKGYTITTIVNPDTKTVDVFQFNGFHSRIAWNSEEAKAAHKGTYAYTD